MRNVVATTTAAAAVLIASAGPVVTAAASPSASGHVHQVHLVDGTIVTVSVASGSAFRLGVASAASSSAASATVADPIPTPTVSADLTPATSKACGWGGMDGLCTSFGALLASPSGDWALYDAANNTVLRSTGRPTHTTDGGVALYVEAPGGLGELPGQPCLSNGMFGPPFAYSRQGKFLAFAVSPHEFDSRSPPSKYVVYLSF